MFRRTKKLVFARKKFIFFVGALELVTIITTSLFCVVGGSVTSTVDSTTLNGKVLLGYQGWFNCPDDGSGRGWGRWARDEKITTNNLEVDMYPDLSEFDADELCPVADMTVNGKQAYLFSSFNQKTVVRHFQWMKDYGLDGAMIQRFLVSVDSKQEGGDVVLKNAMAGAEQHGRTFMIEYDVTGHEESSLFRTLKDDWKHLVDDMNVTSHPNYLHHEGKSVLSVWGMGFSAGKRPPSNPDTALEIIQWFRENESDAYRVFYMGGTPSQWRTLTGNARDKPGWKDVYRNMDVIQPWTVGRYKNNSAVDLWKIDQIEPDLTWTTTNGHMYMPVIFPGFSWYNLKRNANQNEIPRNGGEFLWRQAYNAKISGAVALKIAMFDEVNEAVAMFKVAATRKDAPDQGYWLTLDADGYQLPSDWYLRLAGEITRMFHGEIPVTSSLPSNPGEVVQVPCRLCQDGKVVNAPNITIPVGTVDFLQENITCYDLEQAANDSKFTSIQCTNLFLTSISELCQCDYVTSTIEQNTITSTTFAPSHVPSMPPTVHPSNGVSQVTIIGAMQNKTLASTSVRTTELLMSPTSVPRATSKPTMISSYAGSVSIAASNTDFATTNDDPTNSSYDFGRNRIYGQLVIRLQSVPDRMPPLVEELYTNEVSLFLEDFNPNGKGGFTDIRTESIKQILFNDDLSNNSPLTSTAKISNTQIDRLNNHNQRNLQINETEDIRFPLDEFANVTGFLPADSTQIPKTDDIRFALDTFLNVTVYVPNEIDPAGGSLNAEFVKIINENNATLIQRLKNTLAGTENYYFANLDSLQASVTSPTTAAPTSAITNDITRSSRAERTGVGIASLILLATSILGGCLITFF